MTLHRTLPINFRISLQSYPGIVKLCGPLPYFGHPLSLVHAYANYPATLFVVYFIGDYRQTPVPIKYRCPGYVG